MKKKNSGYQITANVVMMLVAVMVVLPFLLLFLSSITDESTLLKNGYSFFPEKFSLGAYEYIFRSGEKIFRAYGMTILVTVIGTVVNVALSALFSYPLSLKNLPGRRVITFFVFFTMLFNGGLVPSYILWSNYVGVKDTIWGLLLPNLLMGAMNILLIRTQPGEDLHKDCAASGQTDLGDHRDLLRVGILERLDKRSVLYQ